MQRDQRPDALATEEPGPDVADTVAADTVAAVADPVPGRPGTRAAAFFDVDNTLIVGASIFHFARGLAARHFFSSRDLARFAARQIRFRLGGESAEDMTHARESALAFVAGKPVAEIVELGEQIYDEQLADRIWTGTRALAQAHLDAGEPVWVVTATPVELARVIAGRLGLTGALGTVAQEQDGLYTGHLVGEVLHGQAKAEAVRALARREGLDLARCSAYSDSINDLPMLSTVGRAVAVNPDSALRAEARRRGWEVRDFRGGRRAAKVGVPATAAAGLAGVATAVVLRRRSHTGHRGVGKGFMDRRRAAAWRFGAARVG